MKQEVISKVKGGKTYRAPAPESTDYKLLIISADTIYASMTQPAGLLKYRISGKHPVVKLNRERMLSILASCSILSPTEVDKFFNIEVPEPYDHQVTDFAKELVGRINQRLEDNGDIDAEAVEELKETIYKEKTYTIPLNVIIRELRDNEDYISYLMNRNEKINVSREDRELISISTLDGKNSSIRAWYKDGWDANHIIHTEYRDPVNGCTYELSTNIPFFAQKKDSTLLKYVIYTDKLYNNALSLQSLRESYFNVDIGLALFILSQQKEGRALKLNVSVDFVDSMGNYQSVGLKPESVEKLKSDLKHSLDTCINVIEGNILSIPSLLDSRFAAGPLYI